MQTVTSSHFICSENNYEYIYIQFILLVHKNTILIVQSIKYISILNLFKLSIKREQ